MANKIKLLFVCVENSNRSQMSQAFAKILGGGKVKAYSAGSKPSGVINPKAIASMKELGYDLSSHSSKSLEDVKDQSPFDVVVTMGCGDTCPLFPGRRYDDWQLPDPAGQSVEAVRPIRDEIEGRVRVLLSELGIEAAV